MFYKLLVINILTLIRVIGTIILIPIYHKYGAYAASLLALVCYLTDSIDGILARKFKASTFFGALFDGIADKLFTIMNFVVLYLITPYAIIPIIIELLIIIMQIIKYFKNLNIKSNIIGKLKVWILAFSVIFTFLVSDINRVSFIPIDIKEYINSCNLNTLYILLLTPAIIMEILTLFSYILEIIKGEKLEKSQDKTFKGERVEYKNFWEKFKKTWLDPDYYLEHKNDNNLRKLNKLPQK